MPPQQPLPVAGGGSRRTGRPKRLQPPPQSLASLPPSCAPQPVEMACLVYRYLQPRYPATAQSLLHEAAATLPALSALKEQRGVALEELVAQWLQARQREWNDGRLVALLDGLERQSETQRDEHKAAGSGAGGGILQRTVAGVIQLLADYSTLRHEQAERLSSAGPSHHGLLFPSLSPAVVASSLVDSSSSSSAPTASTRKRKSPPASSQSVAATAARPPSALQPHSHATRSGSSSTSTARGLSSLFSSSASPSPSPPQSPFVGPSPLSSPAQSSLSSLSDYLLHIDADELASNIHFAEHLAQHINDRLLHNAHAVDGSDATMTAPANEGRGTAVSSSATSVPSSSALSTALSAPSRLPSLLSSTGSRDWPASVGQAGGGLGELSVPALTDDDYNAMLDELISSTALAESVVVEGPAVQRMNEEEDEEETVEDREEQGEDEDGERQPAFSSEATDDDAKADCGMGERKRAERDEATAAAGRMSSSAQASGADVHTATPRTSTVLDAAQMQAERALDHSHTPQRRQQTKGHSPTLHAVTTCQPVAARSLRTSSASAVCCVLMCPPDSSTALLLRSTASPPRAASRPSHTATPRKTLAQLLRPLAGRSSPLSHSIPPPEQSPQTHSRQPVRPAVEQAVLLHTLTDTALDELLTRIHTADSHNLR